MLPCLNQATCPDPSLEHSLWKNDKEPCNNKTQVCQEGECKGSICLKYNLRPCSITSNVTRDMKALCELTCESDNAACRNIAQFNIRDDVPNEGYLMPGSPCDNYRVRAIASLLQDFLAGFLGVCVSSNSSISYVQTEEANSTTFIFGARY